LWFSPDGRKLMLFRATGTARDEVWLLPTLLEANRPCGSEEPRLAGRPVS
jgi:hypothetical protein